jgi:hypothetical protein
MCEASWLGDSIPEKCATRGGTGIECHPPQALTRYARGTQLSIVGWRRGGAAPSASPVIPRWSTRRAMESRSPPPTSPAAAKPRTEDTRNSTVRILPESFIGEQ